MKKSILNGLKYITSYLPHIKVPIPYRLAPNRSIQVYLDSELGLPLNVREPQIQRFLKNKISEYNLFIDIGAHIGTYSVLATRERNVDVHSFEPHPTNVERLRENIGLNKLHDQVSVVPKAVGDSDGKVKLAVGGNNTTYSLVDEGEQITVECVTLDSYCRRLGDYPDLIKVDVEGAGALVVEGTSEVVKSHPDWLVEVHSEDEKVAFRRIFESNRYTITQLDADHWFTTVE